MRRAVLGAWRLAAAAATMLVTAIPSRAADDPRELATRALLGPGMTLPYRLGVGRLDGAPGPDDTGFSNRVGALLAQAVGTPAREDSAAATAAPEASASELKRQLSNPVTSLWSLTFQMNNFRLENDRWNNNLQFQPVLPISLTRDLNLITRPVLPLYNIVPHETASGQVERTNGLGDMILLELLSPANSGNWILGARPTFIFPTATSTFTGQGKWQAGPGVVVGYLTDKYIVGVFPQQWWSIGGDSDRPDTSQLNLQPIAALFFGEGWNVGYSGNILANWKASSGNVWTVPIRAAVGKVVKLGPLPVKFQLGLQYMPVRPDDGQQWNIQLVITPVIPKLIKGTLFQ